LPKEITPFDFINAASFSKDDLINNHEVPEQAEKLYTAYIVNRGFANFEDTILHANEMNQRPNLFSGAQFDYYRGALRKRKRFSKWFKPDADKDLDALQEVYQCNRTVAKMYQKALSPDQMSEVHNKLQTGG
jgi:hypothetical protein|tara:strand:- start:3248 stop:3643 length:396 start_codon:yes stop_codon:yes gene_type:complete